MALKHITRIPRIPRNIQRVIEILTTLWRHGLGHIVTRLNVQEHLPMVARLATRGKVELLPSDDETFARRLTMALQELGPTFIKLGQILSTRPDFVPEPYLSEFRKLQDEVKPFPSDQAKEIVHKELRKEFDKVFAEFSDEPLASGSIAQTYAAKLLDGTPVVVKVRRPDIERKIDSDIDILRYLARHAERNWPELNPMLVVDEFEKAIHKELDFIVEASYTSKSHEFFEDIPDVKCPKVYWECTTPNILTMERITGIRPDDADELDRLGLDRKVLATNLGKAFVKQYVDFGLFHADPHPGNILIQADGTIALIDFGMTGHLTSDLLSEISTVLIAIAKQDLDILIDVYISISEGGAFVDARKLRPDILEMFDKYYGMPMARIDMAHVFNDSLRIARKHKLVLPRDLVMLMRSMVVVTSVGRMLDPEFNVAELIEPEARRLILRKASPQRAVKDLGLSLWHTSRILRSVPERLRSIVQKIESGTLTVAFKHQGLEGLISGLDRVSNRLSVSIILGSTIVGSSIALQAKILPIRGISAIGIVGYLVAAMLGLWLVWDVLRSGRY
ncbi:MAG: AarF/ABC1/UbiB kinase family protein [Planctomycetes bacterium]|nr:AarF/ABC1/UbiB kinase family protein [Planctomycetota bacterium]